MILHAFALQECGRLHMILERLICKLCGYLGGAPIAHFIDFLKAILKDFNSANQNSATQKSRIPRGSVGAYTVQCGKCLKWRLIPTKEEFETIRHSFIEDPWFCNKKPGVSCDDPADIQYDKTQIWAIDKPNIPKPPCNTERILTMRKDFSKFDASYIMPTGKKVRSRVEVEKFLETHPEYKDKMDASNFSFTIPKIMDDMIPGNSVGKASASSSKRLKTEKRSTKWMSP